MTATLTANQRISRRGTLAGRKQQKQRWRMRPEVLALEERTLLSTFTVNSTGDSGSGSGLIGDLRYCITQANSAGGDETITFDSTVFNTAMTITLSGTQLELSNTTGTETITGPAGGVTVSGGGASRVFQVDNLVAASMSGLTITGGNAGDYFGGGLLNYGVTTLTNCTVSGNYAHTGGGLANSGDSLTLINCTVSGNTGGGLFTEYGTATATNTIIAGNDVDLRGRLDPASTNNLIGGDPVLAPLGLYGGTGETMALLPGSPAIDAGTSGPGIPSTDQRGLSRVGGVDIGAFESQGFTLTPVAGSTPQSANIGTPFANPLAVSVTANNPIEPVDGGVVNFVGNSVTGATAIFSAPSAVIVGGQAEVSAAPNNALGSYTAVASAGDSLTGSFALTNTGTPFTTDLVVNTTSGSLVPGAGLLSLPEAISIENSGGFPIPKSAITFDPTVFAKPQTITLTGSELELGNTTTGPWTITGPAAGVTVSADGASRVFQVDPGVTASISGMTITGGNVTGNGGGLYNDGGNVTLTNCTVSGNSAGRDGGGLYNRGTLTLTASTVSGNSATYRLSDGGGLYNQTGGTTTLTDCTVSGNSSGDFTLNFPSGSGGGISNFGTTTLINCAVSDNSAGGGGGGLYNVGTVTLTNCTVGGNYVAGGPGGGMLNDAKNATASLTNCTVSGNSSPFARGGGLRNDEGTTTLANTIVAGNSASFVGSGNTDVSGSFVSEGNNLIGETDGGSGWVSSDRTGTVASPLNAELAALGNYGGPTQTMPELYGSPAIAAGNVNLVPAGITTDQRGQPRFYNGAVDIGAYQLQVVIVPSFVVDTTADFSDPTDGKTSLREAIASANALPGHTITFDPTVFASAQTITLAGLQLELSDTTGTTTITGSAAGVTVSGGGNSRVFLVDPGVTASISELTLTGGTGLRGGGGLYNNGTVTLTDCTVSGNVARGIVFNDTAAGLYNNGTATLIDCTVSDNSAFGNGGGLSNYGTVTLSNCTVSGNTANVYGGLLNYGTAALTNCTVSGNTGGFGAGIGNSGRAHTDQHHRRRQLRR